jgi:hypothetical protein
MSHKYSRARSIAQDDSIHKQTEAGTEFRLKEKYRKAFHYLSGLPTLPLLSQRGDNQSKRLDSQSAGGVPPTEHDEGELKAEHDLEDQHADANEGRKQNLVRTARGYVSSTVLATGSFDETHASRLSCLLEVKT